MRGIIPNNNKKRERLLLYVTASILLVGGIAPPLKADGVGCPDLRVVFARGSGGERWNDMNYLNFKSTIESKLSTTNLTYEFIDLDYPAVAVGLDNLGVTIGAAIGAGEAYTFGRSVNTGVTNLTELVNSASCANTKYVIGGYSQGAMVVSKAIAGLDADKIIYVATFGDPKLYLPEGEGLMPPACHGAGLSDYRAYVPDCQAYKGLLGAYIPYEPEEFVGKMGTWCNGRDIFCSSKLSIVDHVSYVSDHLYEDASKIIFNKVSRCFGLENHITSPHDTAILIDSSNSMDKMIDQYKTEALRLAKETLDSGGRVALFDYRDFEDPYDPVMRCDFESCTLERFREELDAIETEGGGDEPESLLSASIYVMSSLKWRRGATKSLVVLTDGGFHSPDKDGTTLARAAELSKKIDPVNFYIITDNWHKEIYAELAEATDGRVVTDFNKLDLLTDYIMNRYDSLPRVEESEDIESPPVVTVDEIITDDESVLIRFHSSGGRTLVSLDDAIIGITEDDYILINEIDRWQNNKLQLLPINETTKGMPVEIDLNNPPIIERWVTQENDDETEINPELDYETDSETGSEIVKVDSENNPETIESIITAKDTVFFIPKAPNTGKSK